MSTHIALLRGVNVGGARQVKSPDLRAGLEAAGFHNVRSLIASGNLVFDSPDLPGEALEQAVEAAMAKTFGRPTAAFCRDVAEWDDLVAANPFPAIGAADGTRLVVMALRAPPTDAELSSWQSAAEGLPEEVRAAGRHLYIHYPDGQGRSKLVLKKLMGTARNWNTVLRLQAMLRDGG